MAWQSCRPASSTRWLLWNSCTYFSMCKMHRLRVKMRGLATRSLWAGIDWPLACLIYKAKLPLENRKEEKKTGPVQVEVKSASTSPRYHFFFISMQVLGKYRDDVSKVDGFSLFFFKPESTWRAQAQVYSRLLNVYWSCTGRTTRWASLEWCLSLFSRFFFTFQALVIKQPDRATARYLQLPDRAQFSVWMIPFAFLLFSVASNA